MINSCYKENAAFFRKGKRWLIVPRNGSQKFELKNLDEKRRAVEVLLCSSRFTIENSVMGSIENDSFKISAVLEPKASLIFKIIDRGHHDISDELGNAYYEGVLCAGISNEEVPKDKQPGQDCFHTLPELLVTIDPETESYKKLRDYRDNNHDCWEDDSTNPVLDKLLSIEPISNEKYGQNLPKNVQTYQLTEKDKAQNAFHLKEYEEKLEEKRELDRARKAGPKEYEEVRKRWFETKEMKMEKAMAEKDQKKSENSKSKKLEKSEKKSVAKSGNSSNLKSKKSKKSEESEDKTVNWGAISLKSETQKSLKKPETLKLQKSENSPRSPVQHEKTETSKKPEVIGNSEDVKIQNPPISKDSKNPNIEKKMKKKKKTKKCVIL